MSLCWGLEGGLLALSNSKFDGNIDGRDNEAEFARILGDNGIIRISEDSDINSSGRKWRVCFSQLDFITQNFL